MNINKNGLSIAEKPFNAEIYLSKWSQRHRFQTIFWKIYC